MLWTFWIGRYKEVFEQGETLKTEFYINLVLKQYRPAIIIDYIRTAYRDEISKASITLDRNIKSTQNCYQFFDKFKAEESKKYVLEIKYDNYIPEYIKNIIRNIEGKKVTRAKFISQTEKYKWN